MSDGTCAWCARALAALEEAERHAIAGIKPGPVLGTKRGRSSAKARAHHRRVAVDWIQKAMSELAVRS